MFKRKVKEVAVPAGPAPAQSAPVSYTVPMSRVIGLRKYWLIGMFFLGMVSQFALAVYAPDIWNVLYKLATNLAPAF